MIVLFMVMSFIIGFVDRMCQSFFSGRILFQAQFLALLLLLIFYVSLSVGDKLF